MPWKKLNIFLVCCFVFSAGIVYAEDDCPEQTANAAAAGTIAEERVKALFVKNVPKASTYNDMLQNCIGKIFGGGGINISILGLIPDINSLLAGLCDKLISQLNLPDLNHDIEIDLGKALYEVPIDMNPTLLASAWAEAWPILE